MRIINNKVFLIIDVGHTLTKVAVMTNGRFGSVKYFKTGSLSSIRRLAALSKKADKTYIASVAGFGNTIKKHIFRSKMVRVQDTPMAIHYDLSQLGIDRALSAFGALSIKKPPFVIASVGSAVTIDLVDCKGTFRGGSISPGLTAMYESLCNIEKKLHINNNNFNLRPSKTTSDAINIGVHMCIVGLINEFLNKNKYKGRTLPIVLTGGDAKIIKRLLPKRNVYLADNLVLKGLKRYIEIDFIHTRSGNGG